MKRSFLVITVFALLSFNQLDNEVLLARERLIKNLKAQSPTFDGVAMRTYTYQDVNTDGKDEVIEKQNRIEEGAPGFLNEELYPAFELHRIFTYNGKEFQRDYSKFHTYLSERVSFYKFWRKQLLNPSQLSTDSQGLVKANKAMFLKEIDRLIALSESLKK